MKVVAGNSPSIRAGPGSFGRFSRSRQPQEDAFGWRVLSWWDCPSPGSDASADALNPVNRFPIVSVVSKC